MASTMEDQQSFARTCSDLGAVLFHEAKFRKASILLERAVGLFSKFRIKKKKKKKAAEFSPQLELDSANAFYNLSVLYSTVQIDDMENAEQAIDLAKTAAQVVLFRINVKTSTVHSLASYCPHLNPYTVLQKRARSTGTGIHTTIRTS